ncbi:MAG: ArsA family ATPase [Acidimicrobiales bacterium]
MDTRRFLSASRLLIVAGKGGVGKSVVSAALATGATRAGMRVLHVRIDDTGPAAGTPEGVNGLHLTAGGALAEYLQGRGLGLITRQLERLGIVSLVASTAPGMDDLLVLGKLKQLVRDDPHDVIIVDGPAAGHAVDLLRTPRVLGRTVAAGPVGQQANDVLAMLADPTAARVMFVTRPAATPVSETIETAASLVDDLGITLSPMVVNGVHEPSPVDPASVSGNVRHAAEYSAARHRAEQEAVTALAAAVDRPLLVVGHHTVAGDGLVADVATDLEKAIGGLVG